MPTHTSSQMDKPAGRPARLLLGLTGALLALLILNLAVFDDLRIDPSAGVLETFTKPQHLSSLVAVLIAGALVAFKHRSAARVAVVVAWIEIAAFTFFHVIPVEVGPSKPYWGDGMGDAAAVGGPPVDPRRQRSHRPRCAALVERGRHTGRRERAVMITAEELTKQRGGRAVVSDVTFRCEPGTVTGFLGPNGAGKTTTMRMLVGLSEPDSGAGPDPRRALPRPAEPRPARRDPARRVGATRGAPGPRGARRVRPDHGRAGAARRRAAGARRPRRGGGRGGGSASTRSACASASASPTRCSATPRS